MDRASLPITSISGTGTGAKAHSSATKEIISQITNAGIIQTFIPPGSKSTSELELPQIKHKGWYRQ